MKKKHAGCWKGEVRFTPCHHVQAVGPMGGITSANMPVFVVENRLTGNRALLYFERGVSAKVLLRFGAYSRQVIDRLIGSKMF